MRKNLITFEEIKAAIEKVTTAKYPTEKEQIEAYMKCVNTEMPALDSLEYRLIGKMLGVNQ